MTGAGPPAVEEHPGLPISSVPSTGELRAGIGWAELHGRHLSSRLGDRRPKVTAMAAIARLELVARDVYCGAIGWVDADRGRGELAVAIRTFWVAEGR